MDDVVQMMKDAGAILEGHFIGTSGRHLALYVNKEAFIPHPKIVSKIGKMFAELNKDKDIEAVVGPAFGGIMLSQWTAYHLSEMTGKDVLALYTEKTPENGQFFNPKREYDRMVKGKRVLVVEDTVATGGSVKKTLDAIVAAGGNIVQISLIINRDPKNITDGLLGFPVNSLGEVVAESWGEDEVPEWLKKIPIRTDVGWGTKYLKEHGQA
jgi:orotate phosphoribosyltransferase